MKKNDKLLITEVRKYESKIDYVQYRKCLSSPETNFVFKTFNRGVLIYLQMQILLTFVIYIFVSVLRIKRCQKQKAIFLTNLVGFVGTRIDPRPSVKGIMQW